MQKSFTYLIHQSGRKSILLLLLCFALNCPAQQTRNKTFSGDTAHINQLLKRGYKLRESDTDSSGYLYGRAVRASQASSYRNGIAEGLIGMGRYCNIKNQQARAVDYLKRAFTFVEDNEKGRQLYVAGTLLLAESFFYLGALDSCSFYRYEALNYVETHEMGSASLRLSVYSKILQYWLNAHEEVKHDKNIEQIMQRINDMERQAIKTNDSSLLVNIYFQKEGYYHNINRNDSARYYGLKNIELGRRLKVTPSMMMAAYLNIGITYIDDNKPYLAIENINKAIAEAPLQGRESNRYLIFANIFLGEAYTQLGQYQKAIDNILPAYEKAKDLKIISIMEHAHKTLADAYEGTGDFEKAAAQRKLYSIAKDSLMKTEKMELSYNLEMKYRIAEKNKELTEKELSIVKNEIRIKNKNILIGYITAGLLLITVTSLLFFRNNRQKQKLQSQKIVGLQREMEIKTLKAMVKGSEEERSRIARDLHDGISGTIGSIRAQVGRISRTYTRNDVSQDFTDVMGLLEEAAAEVRKTAHNLMPEILLQEGLVSATQLFCERMAGSHAIEISYSSYGEVKRLAPELELSLYRIIQELVNNILKHAQASHAIVQLGFNGSHVSITVEDDGKGMLAAANEKDFGVGLKTITGRIQSMNGSIDIAGKPGEGTSIYIELDTANINTTTA